MLQCIYVRTETLACLIYQVKNQSEIDIIENRQNQKPPSMISLRLGGKRGKTR